MWFSRIAKTALLVCIGCFIPWTIQALNSADGKITLDVRRLVALASQLGIPAEEENDDQQDCRQKGNLEPKRELASVRVESTKPGLSLSVSDELLRVWPAKAATRSVAVGPAVRLASAHATLGLPSKHVEAKPRRISMERKEALPIIPAPTIPEGMPSSRRAKTDPNFRLAQATSPVSAGPPRIKITSVTITTVDGNAVVWPVDGQTGAIELPQAAIQIKGIRPDNVGLKIRIDEGPAQPVRVLDGINWTFPLQVSQPANIVAILDDNNEQTRELKLIPPDSGTVEKPLVSRASTNALAEPTTYTAGTKLRVFGRFVRLAGERLQPGTELQFPVLDTNGNFIALAQPARPTTVRPGGKWEADLELPLDDRISGAKDEGKILVQAKVRGSGHVFSDTQVSFLTVGLDNPLDAPLITKILQPDNETEITKQGDGAKGIFRWNEKTFWVNGTAAVKGDIELGDVRIVLFRDDRQLTNDEFEIDTSTGVWQAKVSAKNDGSFDLRAATVVGKGLDSPNKSDPPTKLAIKTVPPRVLSAESVNSLAQVKVTFSHAIVVPSGGDLTAAFKLVDSQGKDHALVITPSPPTLEPDNSLLLTFADVHPEVYKLSILGSKISDLFSNTMDGKFEEEFFKPVGDEGPTTSPGITGVTGPYVPYPEYTKPRPIVNGFNPSDHVETRVARLYYYRDAHRVAQIVNRQAKSYNRAAVDMQQQLSDKARTMADQATDDRRAKERRAVEAAQKTREAEQELQQAQQQAASAANQAAGAVADRQRIAASLRNPPSSQTEEQNSDLQAQSDQLSNTVGQLELVAAAARTQADAAFEKVQTLRKEESQATELWQSSIAVEDRAREEQFRREVAAAQADPDTYAPGQPESEDPVRQVSVSVIGEGVIQLRGPIKGINIIRTMINQIDAPVGQVRVGVHTVQINGEKGDRMEQVAGKIQRYIDHSRFLTLQSAEMLRKSIVRVAAQKAMEMGDLPGMTQEERDQKYLYAFFGEDFTRELDVIDSEFLHTGNKLLSIHSMDSTSLASAMFLMALAKNSTRMQILDTFQEMMLGDLPVAEQLYFEEGLTSDGKQRLYSRHCKRNEFELLSCNAHFQSIRGMFDADAGADDTMTPVQREFVRLAQIFKSRLIVEMELKQRVMERAVIEERLGDRQTELLAAKHVEDEAKAKLVKAQQSLVDGQKAALVAIQKVNATLSGVEEQSDRARTAAYEEVAKVNNWLHAILNGKTVKEYVKLSRSSLSNLPDELTKKKVWDDFAKKETAFVAKSFDENETFASVVRRRLARLDAQLFTLTNEKSEPWDDVVVEEPNYEITITAEGETTIKPDSALSTDVTRIRENATNISHELNRYKHEPNSLEKLTRANTILRRLKEDTDPNHAADHIYHAATMFQLYAEVSTQLANKLKGIDADLKQLAARLNGDPSELGAIYQEWLRIERRFAQISKSTPLGDASKAFEKMFASKVEYDFAIRQADAARRPLDHKKFLDMLVDEMEDKYIELLEGTRAHTANIDGYIKRLMTSLDDDFNTQFYYPTFRKVRLASQLWDVQMGQVETTNVLANNRGFAKVSPEATMEFDLPKRDILINEAINSAKATIQDVGALAADPTFLSLARLNSGQPTSSQSGGASGGLSTVRNVLPGLSTDTAESVLGQQGPGGSKFGAAMESLIPEPAIYKFETGTGWEIRPVLQPDGQALVFDFNYMYTTNVREPVRADEKHLGRIKRHFVNTDVQLSNFELREISRYTVALKASRTARGVPLLEDVPGLGVLFRPLPSDESSLQQNLILGQATIFPTLFDLMGLRWAPVVADLDPLRLQSDEFVVRSRKRTLMNRVFDKSSSEVDKFLRIPEGERRMDLYRSQETIPGQHPNGYIGPGANLRDSNLQEGYDPEQRPESQFIPGSSKEGSPLRPSRPLRGMSGGTDEGYSTFDGQSVSEFESTIGDATIVEGPILSPPIPGENYYEGGTIGTAVPNYGAGVEIHDSHQGHRQKQPLRMFNRSNQGSR